VINERFNQFLFGFYPPQLYWRPTLAFILLFVALAPILFTAVPRQALWFSLAYPVIAFFLIWGGMGLAPVESARLGGFMLALVIGVTGIAASLPLGILLALGRQSSMFFIKTICVVFIEFIRGVPLITLLFVASVLLNYFLPPGTSFDLILRVVIMVTLFASAYMAEVIRGGLAALPQGQYEAADSLGLNYWKSTRLIIMPQALKIAIPGIVNTFIGLFKDTTLVSVIGLLDPVGLLNPIRADSNWNGIVWELYVFVAMFFWIFCFSMSRYSMYLERKLKTDR
jgi:general L-amino acid transport system permease protein